MGHLDDDNIPRFTVFIKWTNGAEEIFNSATNVDEDDDRVQFDDRNGKNHVFKGASFHIVGE